MSTIPLFKPAHAAAAEEALLGVLRSGQIAAGPAVAAFEARLQAVTGAAHAVSTNDMSSAMLLALHLCGVRPGDEVLTPAFTCLSSAAPIHALGAQPRWVDVDPETGLIDPLALERALGPRTRCCVLYHLAGYVADAASISRSCREHGLPLIEDCNNALGAIDGHRAVGSHGHMAVYSFYPNRLVHALDGGALTTGDANWAEHARRLRRFGIPPAGFRDRLGEIDPNCDIEEIGWSAAMSQAHAAFAAVQLEALPQRIAAARRNARRLRAGLRAIPGVRIVEPRAGSEPAYWAFLLLAERRDPLLEGLKSRGVLASKLHQPLDRYTGFAAAAADLPGTRSFADRMLALPCGPWLDDADVDHIVDAVEAAAA